MCDENDVRAFTRQIFLQVSLSYGGDAAIAAHHPPMLEPDARGRSAMRRRQDRAAAARGNEDQHGGPYPSLQTVHPRLPSAAGLDVHRHRSAKGRVWRLSRERRQQQAVSVQNQSAGLRSSSGLAVHGPQALPR